MRGPQTPKNNLTEKDKINITIKEIINILDHLNILVPFKDCRLNDCKLYHLNSTIINIQLKKHFTEDVIKKFFHPEVYVCKHGLAHVCSEIGCYYSKTIRKNSVKHCSITNREQSTYGSYSEVNLQLVNGNTIRLTGGGNSFMYSYSSTKSGKGKGGFINSSYRNLNNNFDDQFNSMKFKNFKNTKEREGFLFSIGLTPFNSTTTSSSSSSSGNYTAVKKRYKKIGLRFLNLSKTEVIFLTNLFLLKEPIYTFKNFEVYFSSRRLFLNFQEKCIDAKGFLSSPIPQKGSFDDVLSLLLFFEIISFNRLFITFKDSSFIATKTILKKEEGNKRKNKRSLSEYKGKCDSLIQLISQMELALFKALPGVSRVISYIKKITELHKLFFVKYLNYINKIKPRIHTDYENKILFQKIGNRPDFFNKFLLKTFNFDKYCFFSKIQVFHTFKMHCNLLHRCFKLYLLREMCFENSKKNKKRSKCIDPSEHAIAFLDLSKHGFEIKIRGFSHVIIKRDIFVDKYLERLNKLTFIGFNSSSHNKGIKSLVFDLNYIVNRFGPYDTFQFINYY